MKSFDVNGSAKYIETRNGNDFQTILIDILTL